MKYTLLILSLFCSFPYLVTANNGANRIENAVTKEKTNGESIIVQPLISGAVGLFRKAYQRMELDRMGQVSKVTYFRYYPGDDRIEPDPSQKTPQRPAGITPETGPLRLPLRQRALNGHLLQPIQIG